MDMKETIKFGLTLLVIAAVAAAILAFSNGITEPIITERERMASFAALMEFFPDADDFVDVDEAKIAEIQTTNKLVKEVTIAKAGGNTVGYAFKVASGGYGGDINNLVAINAADDTMIGIKIGSHNETPNIGDKVQAPSFTDQFIGKDTTAPLGDSEVQLISGSTVSSFAVRNGVNDANDAYNRYFTDNEVAEIIEETPEEAKERQLGEIFAEADEFVLSDQSMDSVDEIFEAKLDGELLGYAFLTTSKGYGGDLPVLTGIDLDGTVVGIRIGVNSETPGLGTNIEEPSFTDTFVGKATENPLVAVAAPAGDNEVQMISGATVSTNAALKAVNDAIEAYTALISQ